MQGTKKPYGQQYNPLSVGREIAVPPTFIA